MSDDLGRRYDRMRAAWRRAHDRKPSECDHNAPGVMLVQINANGSKYLYRGCSNCAAPLEGGQWLAHEGIDLETVPVGDDRRAWNPPCQVCGGWGTELHHWAPKAVFGIESGHWPTSWLCQECHAEWHRRMKAS